MVMLEVCWSYGLVGRVRGTVWADLLLQALERIGGGDRDRG